MRVIYAAVLTVGLSAFSLQAQNLVSYVNPLIGSESVPELSNGNTYPSISMPLGLTAWTPQTGEFRWIYQYSKDEFQGMRATHQPSPWMSDYGQFTIMPMHGQLEIDDTKRGQRFTHDDEVVQPHYYSLRLSESNIRLELTPTTRCAFMRVTLPPGERNYVIFDASRGPGAITIDQENQQVRGVSRISSGGTPENFGCYFVAQISVPFESMGIFTGSKPQPGTSAVVGEDVAGYLVYDNEDTLQVEIKIGTSFISYAQAQQNLAQEIGDADFESIRERGESVWENELRRIEIGTQTRDENTVFYTAMYRTLLFPRIFHELDSNGKLIHYSPYDGKIHPGEMYTDNGFWDTFRALFPLYSILYPERYNSIIRGLLNAYREGEWMPKWMSPGYRDVMIGTHTTSVIADAYIKGIRDYDANLAYQAMRKDATVLSDKLGTGRRGIDYYDSLGYVPVDKAPEATARTLEFAFGDFGVSKMAAALGLETDAENFLARSGNYANVFDPRSGFMRGRMADGSWRAEFSPIKWGGPFTEGSAWHYTWSVMHDPQGLINLYGGSEKFLAQLDRVFSTPPEFDVGSYGYEIHEMTEMVLAEMGQYAHGNQPVHHLIYLYNYAGQPWKTQYHAREVMSKLYGPGSDGLIGDEDNGQMSAWFILSALGFYPVSPGYPMYVLGSPLYKSARVHLPNGQALQISAPTNSAENVYVNRLRVNGKEWPFNWLDHATLVAGAKLEFDMSAEPNTSRGTDPTYYPPSVSEPGPSLPYFEGGDGIFLESTTVRLGTISEGAQIRYTVDGTEPNENSLLYTEPLHVSETTTIAARTYVRNMPPSPITRATFSRAELQSPRQVGNPAPGMNFALYRGVWHMLPDFNQLTPESSGRATKVADTFPYGEDNFAINFFGYIKIPQDGLYTFYTRSDDGSKLFVNDKEVVDNDGLHGPQENAGSVALKSGYHKLSFAGFELGGGEVLEAMLEGPGLEKQPVENLMYTGQEGSD